MVSILQQKKTQTNRADAKMGSILPLQPRNTLTSKMASSQGERIKRYLRQMGPSKKADRAILISNKTDQTKINSKRKSTALYSHTRKNPLNGYYGFKHLGSKHKDTKFIKETLVRIKPHTDPHIVIVGVFNTPFVPTDRSSR